MKALRSLLSGFVFINGVPVGHNPIPFSDDVFELEGTKAEIANGNVEVVSDEPVQEAPKAAAPKAEGKKAVAPKAEEE